MSSGRVDSDLPARVFGIYLAETAVCQCVVAPMILEYKSLCLHFEGFPISLRFKAAEFA